MPYITQDQIRPIMAKDWIVKNWAAYDLVDSEEEFKSLINCLQAMGESIDSLHNAVFNGYEDFADVWNPEGWESDRDLVRTVFEFARFYTTEEFIDLMLERREDYESDEEWCEDIRFEASDEPEDQWGTQISKTEDGYVIRVWY